MSRDESLLSRVAERIGQAPSYAQEGVKTSILAAAAGVYGARPLDDDLTHPTGFDAATAALFEAVVEAAFLVANADGDFDDTEREAFQHVVLAACGGQVSERQMGALLADLEEMRFDDGVEKRIAMVARNVRRPEHAREVLRIAALLALVSGGVSEVEREVLAKLAVGFSLGEVDVKAALAEAAHVLSE